MEKEDINNFLKTLPRTFSYQIDGYINSIENVSEDIFLEAKIEYDFNLLNDLLYFAAIKKVWALINSQYWTIKNALSILGKNRITEINIGSSYYTKDSQDFLEIEEFRSDFLNLITELELNEILDSKNMSELLRLIHSKNSNG